MSHFSTSESNSKLRLVFFRLAGGKGRKFALSTLAVGSGGDLLAVAAALGDTLILLADLLGLSARTADGGSWKCIISIEFSYQNSQEL